jgi:hypothetical protein
VHERSGTTIEKPDGLGIDTARLQPAPLARREGSRPDAGYRRCSWRDRSTPVTADAVARTALLPRRIGDELLDLRVKSARVDELRFHMAPPLRLAGHAVSRREYVVLQVTLETGATGTAYVLTRGQRIGAAVEALAQQIPGYPVASLFSGDGHSRGRCASHRARAILDICAWDLVGKQLDVPTWRLLGDVASPQQSSSWPDTGDTVKQTRRWPTVW